MTYFQWRRFNFFDIEKDVDKGKLAEGLAKIKESNTEGNDISTEGAAVVSCRGFLALGDNRGWLHLLDRRFSVKSFQVFNDVGIKLMAKAPKSGLIVCVSDGGANSANFVKIYDLDKPDKTGHPSLVRTTKLMLSGSPTSLAVDSILSLVAVGLGNGTLILIRGDLRRDRGVKQRSLLSSNGQSCISGLTFRGNKLYVASKDEVLLFDVKVKDRETCSQLDNIGAATGMTIATEGLEEAHFATARSDAVYFYSPDGRGQCYAIEGKNCFPKIEIDF